MYDYLIDTVTNFIRHGLNSTAIVLSIIALFRVNSIRRAVMRRLPKRFQSKQDNDLQEIKADIRAIKAHLGVEPCGTSEIAINGRQSYAKSWITSCKAILASLCYYPLRRKKKMRNYLKKLGSRKFQTYLVFTICNIITAYLTWTGAVDVNAQLQGWMPLINGVGQLVAGAVYTWVEGKVDKANAVANSDPGESYH